MQTKYSKISGPLTPIFIGVNDGQFLIEDIVAVLNTISSKFPKATTFPG